MDILPYWFLPLLINVLNGIRNVPEACTIFCATANLGEILETEKGIPDWSGAVLQTRCPRFLEKDTALRF